MLVQNGFAETDAEWDKLIKNEKDPLEKSTLMCQKEGINHKDYGSPQICIDSANLYRDQKQLSLYQQQLYGQAYHNAGIMYTFGKGNKNYKKAYNMFLKAYKVGYGKYVSDVMHKLDLIKEMGVYKPL